MVHRVIFSTDQRYIDRNNWKFLSDLVASAGTSSALPFQWLSIIAVLNDMMLQLFSTVRYYLLITILKQLKEIESHRKELHKR